MMELSTEIASAMSDKGYDLRRARIADLIGARLARQLPVSDAMFDGTFPLEIFELSKIHWTPVSVIMAAVKMLRPSPDSRILDVGSGCGKFCIAAALAAPGIWTGVEIRPHLHEAALSNKMLFRADRAEFIPGNMEDLDWSVFNGFYFYNPFWENVLNEADFATRSIDHSISLDETNFRRYTETVRQKLADCPAKTRVVTYHGFGAELPTGYLHCKTELHGNGDLELWIKQ